MSRDPRADRRRRRRLRLRNQAWANRKRRRWAMMVFESAIRVHEALELTRAIFKGAAGLAYARAGDRAAEKTQ